jgi:hypothetical protein
MPVPKRKPSQVKAVAPFPQEPKSTIWERKITPFLDKRATLIVTLLLLAGAARIAATYDVISITFDEPAHYTAGLEYLTDHAYRIETQHPPLERAASAAIPFLMGARTSPELRQVAKVPKRKEAEGIRIKEERVQLPADPRTQETVPRIRWGVLPFFLIAGLVVYEWARYSLGKPAAVLTTALFTWTPAVLAHAGLATTDIALTATLTAAFLSMLRWAAAPTMKRAAVLGCWTALAVLSKFTTLLYLPATAAAALAGYLLLERPGLADLRRMAKDRLPGFGVAAGIGAMLIWAAYWFSFGATPWSHGIRMPAPELFDGIHSVLEHNQEGHRAFLLGASSMRGFWYFFPVALAVKTPIAILVAAGVGIVACLRTRRGWTTIAFAAGVLAPAMAGHINIGVRHILPIYASFAMLGSAGLIELAHAVRLRIAATAAAGLLLGWAVYTGLPQHPDYLAYFNEFAGSRPERILADSDLDWGRTRNGQRRACGNWE